jgi:serine/threonine protein phosphatase PrpC
VAAVVCDGVSSTRSSELAARAAADAALDVLLAGSVREAIAAAAAAAAALVPRGTRQPPSCTLVCGVLAEGALHVGWVGDSRAYWLAEPGAAEPARLLTADHTAEAAAAAGTLDPAVAAARPDAITRWLGADGDAEPDVATLTPTGPGALLLCSDGLWKYLPGAAELAAVALPALRDDPRAAAEALVAAALAAGGADNVTVAVLPVPLPKEEP